MEEVQVPPTRQQEPPVNAPSLIQPAIAIYQNPDHVAGILQQLHSAPLVTEESRERGGSSTTGDKTENKGHGGAKAELGIPVVGKASLDASGDRAHTRDTGLTSNAKTIQNFKYSQAYYLLEVRSELARRGLIRAVTNPDDAAHVKSGDFVEFQATFRPNALHALLDILTPELIGAITEHRVKSSGIEQYPDFPTIDELKVFSEGLFARAKVHADMARSIAQAVRVDFRTEKTREFYGDIGRVTAITICDNAHFVVEDEDRILDGIFSVLGKVTEGVEEDRPILSRNKLLDRLSPDLVDSLFEMIRRGATVQATKLQFSDGEEREIENAFDVALPSRIDGPSFKVVPIAIYA